MNAEEKQKVFRLLSKFYPNAKQLKDKETIGAWGFVLEHYTYADVKTSVLRYAAKNKFFPDLADITGTLTPVPTTTNSTHTPSRDGNLGPADLRAIRVQNLAGKRFHSALAQAGIPTCSQAQQSGISWSEWADMVDAAGVDLGEIFIACRAEVYKEG